MRLFLRLPRVRTLSSYVQPERVVGSWNSRYWSWILILWRDDQSLRTGRIWRFDTTGGGRSHWGRIVIGGLRCVQPIRHIKALGSLNIGIVFSLCVLCLRALFGSRAHNPNRRRSWLLSSYVLSMFALATIFVTTNTKSLLEGLIQNRNYPGGPLAYWANGYARALTVVPNAASVISSWMADALLVSGMFISSSAASRPCP